MLYEKFKQCQPFRQCIIDNNGSYFAEAGANLKWATGMSPYVTERTAPEYWPGGNYLGNLINKMAENIDELSAQIENDSTPGTQTPPVTAAFTPLQSKSEVESKSGKEKSESEEQEVGDDETEAPGNAEAEAEADDQNGDRGRTLQRDTIKANRKSRSFSQKARRQPQELPTIPLERMTSPEFLTYLDEADNVIQQKRKDLESSPEGPQQDKKQHKIDEGGTNG